MRADYAPAQQQLSPAELARKRYNEHRMRLSPLTRAALDDAGHIRDWGEARLLQRVMCFRAVGTLTPCQISRNLFALTIYTGHAIHCALR